MAGEEAYSFLRAELLSGIGREKGRCEPLMELCHFDCSRLDVALIHQSVGMCFLGTAETSTYVCSVSRAQLNM